MAFNRFSILTRGFAKPALLDWTQKAYRILLLTWGYFNRVIVDGLFSVRGYGIHPGPIARRRRQLPYAARQVLEREKQMFEKPLPFRKIRDYVIVKKIRRERPSL